jgi:hypothetical protein
MRAQNVLHRTAPDQASSSPSNGSNHSSTLVGAILLLSFPLPFASESGSRDKLCRRGLVGFLVPALPARVGDALQRSGDAAAKASGLSHRPRIATASGGTQARGGRVRRRQREGFL